MNDITLVLPGDTIELTAELEKPIAPTAGPDSAVREAAHTATRLTRRFHGGWA